MKFLLIQCYYTRFIFYYTATVNVSVKGKDFVEDIVRSFVIKMSPQMRLMCTFMIDLCKS